MKKKKRITKKCLKSHFISLASPKETIKILYIARNRRKKLKRGKMKNQKYKKSLTMTKEASSFFCTWKRIYFAGKHSLRKRSLYYHIFSKVFLVLQDI